MKDAIHISIFGLNLSLINALKHSLNEILDSKFNLIWTKVTDPHLQLLIIHSDFTDLAHIQKLEQAKIPILQVEKNPQQSSKIQNNTLFLPFDDPSDLSVWLHQYLLPILKTNKITSSHGVQPTYTATRTNDEIFHTLLNPIFKVSSSSKFVIKDQENSFALIDLEQHRFYIKHDLSKLNFDHISLEAANLNDVVNFRKNMKPQDLNQGIWNFVWKHMKFTDQSFHLNYRIKKWPQVQNIDERKDLLKLCAVFSAGSNLEYVKSQLKISEKYIQQFLCVSKLAGILEEISDNQVKYKLDQHAISSNTTQNPMISFFSKLRKKLGI